MHRSLATRMRDGVIACVFVLLAAQILTAADLAVIESTKAREDVEESTDPTIPFWRGPRAAYTDKTPYGRSFPAGQMKNLYFLFVCPYEVLNLKLSPDSSTETFQLWDWDAAEVFIGSDFQNIRRYKEFEISPQGEWVNLDIDLSKPHHEDSRKWNSGFTVAARIDPATKTWYGVRRIPFSALKSHAPSVGDEFRTNLFRSQGPPPNRIEVVWQTTMSHTFHAPEKFGLLRRIAEEPK
jgi:hypothetical protein